MGEVRPFSLVIRTHLIACADKVDPGRELGVTTLPPHNSSLVMSSVKRALYYHFILSGFAPCEGVIKRLHFGQTGDW